MTDEVKRRPRSLEEACELAKSFHYIPTKLQRPLSPSEDLPPEEYKKAEAEYEQTMRQYHIESLYGAYDKDNPLYQYNEPYIDARWEAVTGLILEMPPLGSASLTSALTQSCPNSRLPVV